MVRAIPFGKIQKIWTVIWDDAIFLLFQVSLAEVNVLYSDSLSRNVAIHCLIFIPEISNRMVFVNGKHPMKPMKLRNLWNRETYETMKPWNRETVRTYETMKPMKP